MKTENEKCGEIFRHGPGLFIFSCAFCTEYFNLKNDALDHIESHFLFEPAEPCTDQLDSESIELSSTLFGNFREIEKNGTEPIINIEPLKIEIQDPFLDICTANDKVKLEAEMVPELEEAELNIHKESVHGSENEGIKKIRMIKSKKTVKCDECGKEMQRASLLRHMKRSHIKFEKSLTVHCNSEKEPKVLLETEQTQPAGERTNSTLKPWILNRKRIVKCDVCGREMQKQSLSHHMKIHTAPVKDIDSILKSSYLHFKAIIKCINCGNLMQKKHLSQHLKRYCEMNIDDSIKWSEKEWGPSTAKMLLECDFCGKKLHKRQIRFHVQSHANSKGYFCSICQKKFNNAKLLRAHERIHLDHKKYCCQICGHQFHHASNLTQHIRTHTGEKRYNCKVCDKRFANSYTITLHMRTHTGEKPYSCEICGLKFRSNSVYSSHKKRWHLERKSYRCDKCDRVFVVKKGLQEHYRIHTGERPYTCKVCNLSFARYFTYKQHEVLHTGKKPYKCRFCDKKFAQCSARLFHERSIHKDLKHQKNLKNE